MGGVRATEEEGVEGEVHLLVGSGEGRWGPRKEWRGRVTEEDRVLELTLGGTTALLGGLRVALFRATCAESSSRIESLSLESFSSALRWMPISL